MRKPIIPMLRRIGILRLPILLLLGALPLWAGNSIFSYNGYPVRYYGSDIYSLGMGDAGASDIFRNNTGYGNPAQNNLSNRTLFSTGLLMGYNRYQSRDSAGRKSSFWDNSLDVPHFSVSIPVQKHRLGLQLSSVASGVVENQREFLAPDSTQILEKQSMDRFLYRADLIYSLNLGSNHFGLSGNYYFGHETRTVQQEADFGLFNTREQLSLDFKNPSFTAGYLRSWGKLALGLHYTMGCTLKGDSTRTSIHETEELGNYEYKLPHEFSASVTALPRREFKLAADFHYEAWDGVDDAAYDPGWKIGFGGAYEPEPERHEKYLAKLPLRAGVSYRRLPFRVEDEAVNELALSCGVSLPLKGDVNRIDAGLQYVHRGSLEQNRLSDGSFLLMFGFTGFDIIGKAFDRRAPREIPPKEKVESW